ncbi:hypothetical protein FPRO04_14617 [Fusarium proliferatum]|nr:hypothetical protein FPRO04_14617 [Fusarium proliferatum]
MRAQGIGIEEPKVPGTIDMKVTDDSKTAYGLSLTPTPSADPNDPLNWTQRKKYLILFLVSMYSFLANGALIGPSVYVNVLAQQFGKTPSQTSQLVNNPNLLFGLGKNSLLKSGTLLMSGLWFFSEQAPLFSFLCTRKSAADPQC